MKLEKIIRKTQSDYKRLSEDRKNKEIQVNFLSISVTHAKKVSKGYVSGKLTRITAVVQDNSTGTQGRTKA